MKIRTSTSILIVLASSIGFAACAVARTPPTSDQARKDMNAQKQDPLTMQSSGGEDWSTLQGHEKGYVSKVDAAPNSWLALNFTKCDMDGDGKVTETEYTKCQRPQR